MFISTYTIPPASDYPFYTAAKRYWVPEIEEQSEKNPDAQTLIVLHSTSFHKEIWEPVLQVLYNLITAGLRDGDSNRTKMANVRDAWAIECPNHGESAYLNLRACRARGQSPQETINFSCQKYAEAVHRFLRMAATHPNGPKIDFRKRNLVGIGHSLGANTMQRLLLQPLQPVFNFSQLVIIEPMVSAKGPSLLHPLREELVSKATRRKDTWPTLEMARKACAKRNWDPRVVEVFVKHALYWSPEMNAFTLCCSREQEVGMYMDIEGPTRPVEVLNGVCHSTPVHIILGDSPDFIPKHVHNALVDPHSGRRFASVTRMKNVGHLIPQERPSELAQNLFGILSYCGPSSFSRL